MVRTPRSLFWQHAACAVGQVVLAALYVAAVGRGVTPWFFAVWCGSWAIWSLRRMWSLSATFHRARRAPPSEGVTQ